MEVAPETLALYLPAADAAELARAAEGADAVDLLRAGDARATRVNGWELDAQGPGVRVAGPVELAEVERRVLADRALDALRRGVRLRDPANVYVRGELVCGAGVEIDVNVVIEGRVRLGDRVSVGAHVILRDATIGAGCSIRPFSIVEESEVGADTVVGPYARIRPGSSLGASVQIGNFVEIKKSEIGAGSRINHLSFVGDATVGERVILGAGTITCNHSPQGSVRTEIGAGAYIGSGTELVAPLVVGEHAVIGAGSTITEDVPAGRLTIARARQVTIQRGDPDSAERRDE
jgi:bifunctional UDP-N-acetylglucosamine pyrophosphorylase/glucosamine-1-phosphate N-acetyltransferase